MSDNQLTLPYEEITKLANRDYLRKNFTISGRVAYKIQFGKIEERDNFNKRKVYDEIEELAQSILINGLKEPLVLDILHDGRAIVEQGHRRRRAIQLLIDRKETGWTKKTEVEFFPNKSEVTEMHRIINQLTSNNLKKKLKPFEAAEVAHDVKYNFSEKPRSNEEVAELMGLSRQQVDNYILIASADDLLKNEMLTADMNLTECVALVRNKKKVEKQSDKAEEDSHKNSGAPTPAPKDDLAGDIKDLKKLEEPTEEELAQQLEELLKISDEGEPESKEEMEKVNKAITGADKIAAIVAKLDVPEQTKNDLDYQVHWLIENLTFVRDWCHKNKPQNKRGH